MPEKKTGMYQRGRGKKKTWWIDRMINGVRVARALHSNLSYAVEIYDEIVAQAKEGTLWANEEKSSWESLTKDFIEAKKSEGKGRQWKEYETLFSRLAEFRVIQSIEEIDVKWLREYRNWRKNNYRKEKTSISNRTINKEVGMIGTLFNYCIQILDIPERNPVRKLKKLSEANPSKQRRALSESEVKLLLAELEPNFREFVEVLLITGCRSEEIQDMEFGWINWRTQTFTVPAIVAKTSKERLVPINKRLTEIFKCRQKEAKNREPHPRAPDNFSRTHVFVTTWNTPMKNNLMRKLRAAAKKARLEGWESGGSIDIHALRHTMITRAYEKGNQVRDIQEAVGHRNLATTERYTHANFDKVRRVIGE